MVSKLNTAVMTSLCPWGWQEAENNGCMENVCQAVTDHAILLNITLLGLGRKVHINVPSALNNYSALMEM